MPITTVVANLRTRAGVLGCVGILSCSVFGGDAKPEEELTQAGVQAAFQILRKDYIRGEELNFEQLNRSALEGLMLHLGGGAKVVTVEESEQEVGEPEVREAVLADGIGWVRPLTYGSEEVEKWYAALQKLKGQGCHTVVLDLRESAGSGSFDVAAAMLEGVVSSGQVLFKLKQSGKEETEVRVSSREPIWVGQVVVLVDQETGSVGETVAAVLQYQKRAVVVGEKTRGATVRYQTLPLDKRFALQYASAELLMADGTSLFQKGLPADLEVKMTQEEKELALERMSQGRVRELIHEVARERFNEAALVARRNPELEEYLKRSAGETTEGEKRAATDAVLQRAVDAVQSRETLSRSKISWEVPAAGNAVKEEILKAPQADPVTGSR
jgi:Peptidase family S41